MLPDSIQFVQLAWGLLALPIIALYYWTFRRQREEVATFALWSKALARRSPWSKWRRLVSLTVQLSVLALLVIALAQLDWSQDARGIKSFVLVVDTSASMKAIDVAPSRFGQSVAETRRAIAALGRDEKMAIITAGAVPQVLCRPIEDQERLTEILDKLACSEEPGQIGPAVELAERMLTGAPNPRILVYTDGRSSDSASLANRNNVEVKIAGEKPGNVAITRLVAVPSPVSQEHEVLVEAANFSAAPATARIELSLSGQKLEPVSLEIPPGGKAQRITATNLATGGLLTARLETGDAFPLDDMATALVPSRREVTCVFVGNEGSHLGIALSKIPGLTVKAVSDSTQPFPEGTVYVFDGVVPRELPKGAVFAVTPTGSSEHWDFGKSLDGRVEVKSQTGDPPLGGIDLSEVVLDGLVRLKFKGTARTLAAAASGEPVLTLLERPTGNVLVWHVQLDKSDFSQRVAFPLFVAQAVRLLANADDAESLAFQAGQRISQQGEGKDGGWSPPSRGGKDSSDKSTSAILNEVGIWQVKTADGEPIAVAPVNLFDVNESELQTTEVTTAGPPPPPRSWLNEPLWIAFLAGALLLLMADWFLLHRRTLV